MNMQQFEKFLEEKKNILKTKSDAEKLRSFIIWCKQKNIEEIILRLSSEGKGGWSNNYFLDFTTTRLIVTKKSFSRKFLDVGYIAGLAPFPAVVLSEKLRKKLDDRKQVIASPDELLYGDNSNYFIWYSDIQEFVFRKGIDSTIVNMFGRMLVSNYIKIKTANQTYEYKLPVNKNGSSEQILPWLSVVLPVKISTS